ncbi:MAG: TnpV protein [Clostridia bacterium]|nr:TnpV protein [Clostridia bacterium]
MKINYVRCGDYLIPTLTVPNKRYNISKYGMLRREYLKNHRQSLYSVMMLNGTLLKHLAEIDKTCHEVLDRLIPQMAEREGVTEVLKAADQMEWVRQMESIKSRIEEILYHDYIYEEEYRNEEI